MLRVKPLRGRTDLITEIENQEIIDNSIDDVGEGKAEYSIFEILNEGDTPIHVRINGGDVLMVKPRGFGFSNSEGKFLVNSCIVVEKGAKISWYGVQ